MRAICHFRPRNTIPCANRYEPGRHRPVVCSRNGDCHLGRRNRSIQAEMAVCKVERIKKQTAHLFNSGGRLLQLSRRPLDHSGCSVAELTATAARFASGGTAARLAAAVAVAVVVATGLAAAVAARSRGAAGRGRSRSAAGRLAAAVAMAAVPVVVATGLAAAIAAGGRSAARGLGGTRRGSRSAAGGLGSTTRRFTTTIATKNAGLRIRSSHDEQAGDEQGRQHNAGSHDGTPKQNTWGVQRVARCSRCL